jgi:hypothetical protein
VTWQAAHPGWILDGSQVGYHLDPAYQSGQPAPPPPATPPAAAPPPVAVAPYSFQPAGVQAPTAQWNYSPTTSGSMWVYPPGTTSPYSTPDISSPYAVSPQVATNMYYYGGAQAPATQTPQPAYDPYNAGTSSDPQNPLLPNQINAQNYNSMYQYQKDLGWAAFEDQGYDKGLAQEAFEKSKPNTGGPLSGHFAF